MNYLEIRRTIQSVGNEFFEKMWAANCELGNIAGEFMSLNEEYVLNHQGINENVRDSRYFPYWIHKQSEELLRAITLPDGGF